MDTDFPRRIYSDQTGCFSHTSSRGHKYIMVMYNHDSNAIDFEALKTRQGKELTMTFIKLCNKSKLDPTNANLFILDNKCSSDVKSTISEMNASFQLVPPHQHRQNAAENAIKTFKSHFLIGLATCDKKIPISEWDRLLSQAEWTLNLLRNARMNPKLSSWAYINRCHDFNRHPLARPGTKLIVHSKPSYRSSWTFGLVRWPSKITLLLCKMFH